MNERRTREANKDRRIDEFDGRVSAREGKGIEGIDIDTELVGS